MSVFLLLYFLEQYFEVGKAYTLYINPKKPEDICCNKVKLTAEMLGKILIGGYMTFLCVVGGLYKFIIYLLNNL